MSYPAARGSPPRAGHSLHAPRRWPSGGAPGFPESPSAQLTGSPYSATASPRSVNSRDRYADVAGDGASGGANGGELDDPRHHPPSSWITGSGPPNDNQQSETQLPWASGSDHSSDSYSRERLPSSQSTSSVTHNSRGRRAPAPAALDLGHCERVYSAEPESVSYSYGQRHDMAMPVPRPFPTAPAGKRLSMNQATPNQSSSPPRTEPVPFPTHHSPLYVNTSPPLHVPLSAVGALGLGSYDDRRASLADQRSSVATNGDRVSYVSIDSYYLNAGTGGLSPGGLSPGGLSPGGLSPGGLSPGDSQLSYPPSTPEYMDPSNIDRRGLIGVGELATPRWGPSDARHLRTPSMPHDFALTPPLPPFDRGMFVGSAPGRQPTVPVNLNVMERVTEESPRKERVRHRSVSHDTPQRAQLAQQQQQQQLHHNPSTAPPIDNLISSIGDFSFDSTIEPGTLAASLAMPNPQDSPPPSLRASAPPAPKHQSSPSLSQQSMVPTAVPPLPPVQIPESATISPPVPGSARERIYARRMSRQAALSAATGLPAPQMVEIPPLPVNIPAMSPPTSADSQTQTFGSRKTPPGNRESMSRRRVPGSPSAPHHDILRHIAPKDFSHLPPSPSTASISHLLRGSTSGHNLSSVRTPPGSTSGKQPALTRSDSMKSARSRAQSMKAGEANATAEALRKLDGLGTTPKKPGGGSGGMATPRRVSSPPDMARRLTGKHSVSSISNARDRDMSSESPYEQPMTYQHHPSAPRSAGGQSGISDVPPLTFEKRESSPSVVGTPTSRESHGPPSTTTTPPSGHRESRDMRAEKAMRRPSFASDLSSMESPHEQQGSDGFVPPVPPLPRGYQSMRQGLSTLASSNPLLPSQYVALQPEELHRTTREQSAPPALTFPSPISQHSSDPASHQTSPLADTPRTRTMSKKWSFSSALSLNKLHGSHGKDKESSASPTLSPSAATTTSSIFEPSSPPTPWKEDRMSLASPRAAPLDHIRSRDSMDIGGPGVLDTRSNHSVTPVAPSIASGGSSGLAPPPLPKSNSKRLTPSSIPFFRRSSASSVSLAKLAASPEQQYHYQQPAAQPRHSVQAAPAPVSTSQRTPSGSSRKSMLGMHIPAMLRGSASKRGLANQAGPAPQPVEKPPASQTVSFGHTRARRMTLSSGGDHSFSSLTRKPSVDSRSFSHHPPPADGGIVNGNGNATPTAMSNRDRSSKLPVAGQQTLHNATSASSLRKNGFEATGRVPPTATPTKIPRIASRPSVVTPNTNTNVAAAHMSMPPPAIPHSQSSYNYRSSTQFGSTGSNTLPAATSVNDVSEFGAVGGPAGTRQSMQPPLSFGSHRSQLLAPGSGRKHSVSGIPAPPSATNLATLASRRETMGAAPPVTSLASTAGLPASRRALPQIPSSATAMTISAAAKARPAVTRRGSASPAALEETSIAIKPSKSFHTKAATAGHSRMSLSSSVGASGSSRRQSLATESASSSPVDNEEAIADAEMGAYVTRRKARAASGSKKDDLSDLIGFPEDIGPAQPVSQRVFIGGNLNALSDFERKEVLDFDLIYYMARGVKRPKQPDGKVYNHGYDDERGDYVVVEGDHLCYRYEVIGILGKGSFGQVVHCRDHKTGGSVAVKIIRNKKRFHAQALVEVKILQQIVDWDPEDKHYMVKMTDHFYFRSHLCIVTELLSINLYELIKANQFNGFSTTLIRRFTSQMLSSLMLMRSHRIVHCDLKPENILLRHPAKSGIKVIDFGSSCHESEKVYTYIQSRFYRSPEVILGMNYAMAIDMWSLGCILAELYTGYPIFPGENEHEQLACIMEVLGVPDHYIVQKASRRKLFFDATGAPRPFVNAKGKRRRPGTKTLASVLKCNDELFIDFISKCLTWDPDKRLKPQPAMRHPWILAGRRRSPPPPLEREGRASFLSSSARRSTVNGDKKNLVISPPTPLVARAPQAPSSASRIGVSMSTARLHVRNSTYVPNAQKVSMA